MAFTPDEKDLDFAIGDLKDLTFDMEKFIGEVFSNEYILVIGKEVILDPNVVSSGDVNDYLLENVNNRLKTNYKDFNEVIQHSNVEIDPIRNLLSWDKFKKSMVLDDLSKELVGLLKTKLFKVVITTTFDSYLELLMRNIWGDQLRIVNIWDQASLKSFRDALGEYQQAKDYNEPTLIYAFGKCEEKEERLYAREDFDYILTMERWMQFDKRSDKMMEFIQSKRLLSLGCKFEDWYFRFFWFILKREKVKQREGEIAIVFDDNDRSDKNLQTYLFNARVVTHGDSRKFMNKVTTTLTSLEPDNPYRDQVLGYRRRGVIFFSYCNRDRDMARKLFQRLSPLYPNLWFDEERILGGDNYESEISYGIGHAKVFIPLLTPEVAKDLSEGKTDNYYNEEWRMAASRGKELTIIPLATSGYDLRKSYHTDVFQHITGGTVSGVDFNEPFGLANLQKAIDEHLKE